MKAESIHWGNPFSWNCFLLKRRYIPNRITTTTVYCTPWIHHPHAICLVVDCASEKLSVLPWDKIRKAIFYWSLQKNDRTYRKYLQFRFNYSTKLKVEDTNPSHHNNNMAVCSLVLTFDSVVVICKNYQIVKWKATLLKWWKDDHF